MNANATCVAARLLEHATEIVDRWTDRVRREISASRQQKSLVLENNLKLFLREVAWALDPNTPPPALIAGRTLSEDHGNHRAELSEYDVGALFLEYRVLRQTILEVLGGDLPLSLREREIINNALERAVQDAVTQFSRAHQEADRCRSDDALRDTSALRSAYERERRIAQVLQRPLLVKVAEDAVEGLSLATCYEPARDEAEVGGDFFDVIPMPDHRVALAVGDTCGKGLEAAVHNTHVKDVLRAFLREGPETPDAVLTRLNRVVCDVVDEDPDLDHRFVVLALLVLEPTSGEGYYSAAGAEPLLLVRTGGETEEIQCPALPLGIQPESGYASTPIHLGHGDTAVLVTDGLTEARNGRELLGYPGMTELARRALQAPTVNEAGRNLLAGVHAFTHGPLSDDACLILARRR